MPNFDHFVEISANIRSIESDIVLTNLSNKMKIIELIRYHLKLNERKKVMLF